MYFGVSGKATRGWYYNVGLIPQGAEDVASESPENRRFWLPHCRLMPPLQGTPRNIRTNLILRILSHWVITSSSLIVRDYLHSNFRGGLRKTHVFRNRVRNGFSRSSKVVDFGTNRKRVRDFLLVISSNLGPTPILPGFRDIAGFLLRTTIPLFRPNFRGVPQRCGSEERRP